MSINHILNGFKIALFSNTQFEPYKGIVLFEIAKQDVYKSLVGAITIVMNKNGGGCVKQLLQNEWMATSSILTGPDFKAVFNCNDNDNLSSFAVLMRSDSKFGYDLIEEVKYGLEDTTITNKTVIDMVYKLKNRHKVLDPKGILNVPNFVPRLYQSFYNELLCMAIELVESKKDELILAYSLPCLLTLHESLCLERKMRFNVSSNNERELDRLANRGFVEEANYYYRLIASLNAGEVSVLNDDIVFCRKLIELCFFELKGEKKAELTVFNEYLGDTNIFCSFFKEFNKELNMLSFG